MKVEKFRRKKVLIVGVGKTGFALINFFNKFDCIIKVTDIKPIFDLNKAIKKLKKITPPLQMTFGEHNEEDFKEADIIVHSPAVNPHDPKLEMARNLGKEVYSEFSLANELCHRPIIAVCGSFGRTTVGHILGFAFKIQGKKIFVGGTGDYPFINYYFLPNKDEIDYVIVEASAMQMRMLKNFHPHLVVLTSIDQNYSEDHFHSWNDYMESTLSIVKDLGPDNFLVCNFDGLANNATLRKAKSQTFWYSRKSFVKLGVINELQGTHFHKRRIHSNIHYHSEFKVSKMRIIGVENRQNLLAAITVLKALNTEDKFIQETIEKFPGIPHRLEFLMEKNGVSFYNDSKSETMPELVKSLKAFKSPVILIAGGKDVEERDFDSYANDIIEHTRILVLVGECKERFNRALQAHPQTYIVGSFDESVLFAYQKSRTGDTVLLSPGNPSSDFFRDSQERGEYFKKLVYQF